MTIPEIEKQIAGEFEACGDWTERYAYLISLGEKLTANSVLHTPENQVLGCQSNAWVAVSVQDGIVNLQADADSLIVKGLVALVIRLFNGQPASAIQEADLKVFNEIGFAQHLSPSRASGLFAIIQHIKKHL